MIEHTQEAVIACDHVARYAEPIRKGRQFGVWFGKGRRQKYYKANTPIGLTKQIITKIKEDKADG